jgi:hypothetical protein
VPRYLAQVLGAAAPEGRPLSAKASPAWGDRRLASRQFRAPPVFIKRSRAGAGKAATRMSVNSGPLRPRLN